MAELLVKAVDYEHPDPDKDRRGAWKRGMPVVAMADGHSWGREEVRPPDKGGKFVILKFPGISIEQMQKYMEPERSEFIFIPGSSEGVAERRRAYRFKLDDMPLAVREALSRDGSVTTTWEESRGYLEHISTGKTEANVSLNA